MWSEAGCFPSLDPPWRRTRSENLSLRSSDCRREPHPRDPLLWPVCELLHLVRMRLSSEAPAASLGISLWGSQLLPNLSVCALGGAAQLDPALQMMAGFQAPPHSSHRESHLAHPNHMRQVPDETLIQSLTDTPQPTHSHRTSKPERSQDHLEQLPFASGETKSQEREEEVGWEPGPS